MLEFIAGHQFIELDSLDSTNNFAAKLLQGQHPKEGTVILSHKQTKGKGQRHASWISEAGMNLTFSIILYPTSIVAHEQFILNQMISLAILNFIKDNTSKKVEIKWPNDILLEQKKICGILIENSLAGKNIEHSIVGVGLNLNQEVFTGFKATSLKLEEDKEFDIKNSMSELLESIDQLYYQVKSGNFDTIKQNYLEHLFQFKALAKYVFQGEIISARIEAIDKSGRLVLQNFNTEKEIVCDLKEIEFVF